MNLCMGYNFNFVFYKQSLFGYKFCILCDISKFVVNFSPASTSTTATSDAIHSLVLDGSYFVGLFFMLRLITIKNCSRNLQNIRQTILFGELN